jgi:hypothetical protein
MILTRCSFSRTLPFALVAALGLVPAGCGTEEGVSRTQVPRATDTGPRGAPAADAYRLLGLMVPADDPQWFFKYNGPIDEITKYEAGFDTLAATVSVSGGAVDFTPPEGWQKGPGRDGFVRVLATVRPTDGKAEVTVTQSAGGVGQNLDRWVGQIGLRRGGDDVAKYTKVIDGKGVKVRRVDLRGPTNPATKRGPMMGGQ